MTAEKLSSTGQAAHGLSLEAGSVKGTKLWNLSLTVEKGFQG